MTIDLAGIAKICEEVFDSITIYIHITSSIQNPKFYQVSFSSIPFSDPTWKDKLFHFTIGQVTEDDAEEIADLTYHRCLQAMNQFAFILTIKGHDVYYSSLEQDNETLKLFSFRNPSNPTIFIKDIPVIEEPKDIDYNKWGKKFKYS